MLMCFCDMIIFLMRLLPAHDRANWDQALYPGQNRIRKTGQNKEKILPSKCCAQSAAQYLNKSEER